MVEEIKSEEMKYVSLPGARLEKGLPVLNYAQLIVLAMGADAYEVVGVQSHSVPLEAGHPLCELH
ncbi:MAG: hypothetical protein ACXQTW_07605 [Candidatus Methanospirareceae archaeon]